MGSLYPCKPLQAAVVECGSNAPAKARFVMLDGSYPEVGEIYFGVTTDTKNAANDCAAECLGEVTVEAAGAITAGVYVAVGTNGRAVAFAAASHNFIAGVSRDAAAQAGDFVRVALSARASAPVQVDGTTIEKGESNELRVVAGGIGSDQIADEGVDTDDLADGAVTTDKLDDAVVTVAKLTDDAQPLHLLSFPVLLADVANGDVLTDYPVGFAFEIVSFHAAISGAVTTGAKAAALGLEIGAAAVTGGAVALSGTYALGAVVAGSEITGANVGGASDTLTIKASGVTAFAEGSAVLNVLLRQQDAA